METGKVKKVRCTEGRKGRHIHHKNPLAKGSACEPCRQRKVSKAEVYRAFDFQR